MTAVEFLFKELCSEKLSWNKDSNGKLFFDDITSDILQQAKEMEEEQNNAKIQKAIELFEEAKRQADIAKDVIYLDGVLAVLDGIKNTKL